MNDIPSIGGISSISNAAASHTLYAFLKLPHQQSLVSQILLDLFDCVFPSVKLYLGVSPGNNIEPYSIEDIPFQHPERHPSLSSQTPHQSDEDSQPHCLQ